MLHEQCINFRKSQFGVVLCKCDQTPQLHNDPHQGCSASSLAYGWMLKQFREFMNNLDTKRADLKTHNEQFFKLKART
jgi:hypothetical protein